MTTPMTTSNADDRLRQDLAVTARPPGPACSQLPPLHHAAQLARFVAFFETLTPQSLARLGEFYHGQARFKDPFNEVTGVAAIAAIFEHMFVTLAQPRFVVTNQALQGNQCFLTWEFSFYFRNFRPDTEQRILGASHILLSDEGLVTLHRDYWDAAEELYEKLPLAGSLMRWLKRRASQ